MEAPPRLELGVELLQSSALPLGYGAVLTGYAVGKKLCLRKRGKAPLPRSGASDEARTRYLHLGKVALYQMSYTRIWVPRSFTCGGWCLRSESNQRHEDFQSSALPTELQRHMATRKGPLPHPTAGQAHRSDEEKVATRKGLEPSTSGVTGRRSNQLNYRARQFRGIQGPKWWEQQGSNL